MGILFVLLVMACVIWLVIDYRAFRRMYGAKPEHRKQQEWEDSQW